jgi:CubicO group peptidase (beta-lactamase class C family)
MTATLAAMFVEEGKLRWDTRITEALPELKGKVHADFEAVTLEMLLQHRGGLATAALPSAWKRAWEKDGTPTRQRAEFIAAVLAREPAFKPGTKFNYSNQGYAVVGAMIEKLAGSPWETLMAERIFRPLEMKTAGFGAPGAAGKVDEPWGHTIKAGKNDPSQSDNPPSIGPGGTVHCSMEDLSRFTRMHLRRGRDGGQLKPDYFRRLHTPPEGQDYACGWSSLDRGWAGGKALTHNGSNTMWFVVMWLAPERDFSVVVGTNVAGTAATKACDDVAAAMIGKWLPR